jgi:DNA polymerase-4
MIVIFVQSADGHGFLTELQLTASAGVAPNKFLAKIASDWKKPDALFVIQPDEVDSFLISLPVGRVPGVGKVTEDKLQSLGVQTIGDLRRFELASLALRKVAGSMGCEFVYTRVPRSGSFAELAERPTL